MATLNSFLALKHSGGNLLSHSGEKTKQCCFSPPIFISPLRILYNDFVHIYPLPSKFHFFPHIPISVSFKKKTTHQSNLCCLFSPGCMTFYAVDPPEATPLKRIDSPFSSPYQLPIAP